MTGTASEVRRTPAQQHWRRAGQAANVLAVLTAGLLDLGTAGVLSGPLRTFGGMEISGLAMAPPVLVMVALLFVRRRYPLPVLLATTGISIAAMLVFTTAQPIFCVLVAVHAAARRGTLRHSLLALAIALTVVPLVMLAVLRSYDDPTPIDWIFPGVFFAVLVMTAWGVATRDRLSHERNRDLHGEIDVRAEQAAHAERHRIARELHDIVAHSVSAMMMQAAGARAMSQSVSKDVPDDARLDTVQRALGTIESTGAQSMRELHRLLGALREDQIHDHLPSSLDLDHAPSAQPGLGDIDALVEVPRSSGLIVEVHRSGHARTVDPSVGAAAYRVVQESLTNALKHAGRGALVDVYLAWQDTELQVQVRSRASHGMRPGTPNGGTGLRGLRERVGLVGGSFEAGWSGEEFINTAVLPVRPPTSGGPAERPAPGTAGRE
ncbi:putative two-component system sensor kinase [Serinicoccus hydrothermalis]|uniref:histidine kinase n=1 Tax=Serinicoccus hydrothermalis TaxID=1758689 RepID=A0A1B1NEB9_9MICO|nr:histidine kinase [Serinicoccus hydrothermalis]ANS79776.1 putative two-component system sensor kinase [Serinicoccus hydrothermalis]